MSQKKVPKIKGRYLDLLNQPIFTFIVNKKEYKCNSFAVNASKVISDLREKDPELMSYVYDFDDPNNDFRYICSFFNFQKTLITTQNMNSLLQIAEDLKIDIILNDINNFIDSFETVIQESDVIEKIFIWLYNISTFSVATVKSSIIESIWCHSEGNIQELAAIILQVARTSYQIQPFLIELIILLDKEADETNDLNLLVPFLAKQLMICFFKSRFYCSFVYKMSSKGIVSIDEILSQIYNYFPELTKKISTNNLGFYKSQIQADKYHKYHLMNVIIWFLPELIEIKHISIKQLLDNLNEQESRFVRLYLPNKLDNFKKMRDSGLPEDEIVQAIILDDVDTLQSIISKRHINTNLNKVPFNLFEIFNGNVIVNSYINYAAQYGSIKCFKFLLLNHAELDKFSLGFAVYGGNAEIIRIIDQQQDSQHKKDTQTEYFPKSAFGAWGTNNNISKNNNDISCYAHNDKSLIDPIIPAIMMHKYDLFDWLFEKKAANKELTSNYLSRLSKIAIQNGNIHTLVHLIDNGFSFNENNGLKEMLDFIAISCSLGYYRITRVLFGFNTIEKNDLRKYDKNRHSSVLFGNLSIFKLFYEDNKTIYESNAFDNLLVIVIQRGYLNIFKYINELVHLTKEQLCNDFVNAINSKSFLIVDYLKDLVNLSDFKKETQFSFFGYDSLMHAACSSDYLKLVKEITEIVTKITPNINFTRHFITAAKSGSKDICQYFIDQKVSFFSFEILQNYESLDLGMGSIMVSLINQSDPELKEKFSKIFLNEAIKKGNKNLVDLLIDKNSLDNQALFDAVKTHDIELVEKVLKCQNKPSFINQISDKGTALNIAVCNNDIAIVKRLLSVPGINPNLYIGNKITPLISAIDDLNLDMINLILDYFGDDIQSNLWQINNSLENILRTMISDGNGNKCVDKNTLLVLDRLVQIKNVDLNLNFSNESFLLFACKKNEIELANILLKSENIDVNLYEPIFGYSPLMTAIMNKNLEIAKLLLSHPQIDLNFKNNKMQTAFIIAVNEKVQEIIPLLLNHEKFDPEESDIGYAFYISEGPIMKQLINCKYIDVNYTVIHQEKNNQYVDIFAKKNLFETTLMHSISQRNLEKIDLILEHPTFDPVKSQIKQAIFDVSSMTNIEIFKRIWKYLNNDVNLSTPNGTLLFIQAATLAIPEVISEILNKGDFKDNRKYFCTAFENVTHRFNSNDVIPILKEIVEFDESHNHYIDFNQLLENGETYLTSIPTFEKNIDDIVKFYLDHNVDPNMPNGNGIYPLQRAIEFDSLSFVITLLDSGKIDYSVRLNENHETYLHLAAKCINLNIMDEFTKRKLIDPDITDDLGKTAADYRKEILDKYQAIVNEIIEKTKDSSFSITQKFINEHYDLLIEFLRDFDSLDEWEESYIDDFIEFIKESFE